MRDASALMNDPIPEIQPYYVSIRRRPGRRGRSATLTLLHSYIRDRASEVFIDKNSINHGVPRDKRLASPRPVARLLAKDEKQRGRGEPLCCADRSNNATTRVRHSRPADLRSGRAIIRDFLPARNKRPSHRGGGSEFNLTAFITRYRA